MSDPTTTPRIGVVYNGVGVALITIDGVALTPAALAALVATPAPLDCPDAQTRVVAHARDLLSAAEADSAALRARHEALTRAATLAIDAWSCARGPVPAPLTRALSALDDLLIQQGAER
jgi:hypothetical protein